jgi:hypothetical protein
VGGGVGNWRNSTEFKIRNGEKRRGKDAFFFFEKEKREGKTREGSGPEMLSLAQP